MASASEKSKIVVIVGPTASGKSSLAMKIAEKFNGEIICADSRTIYRGMNVGTAKPSLKDQKRIPHWGLDLLDPGQSYSAARFKKYADAKIAEIKARGCVPILVGGTGLYIDSIIFDFKFPKNDLSSRQKLEGHSVEELQQIIKQHSYKMPENYKNKRYLIRAIERAGEGGSSISAPKPGTILVGLRLSDNVLRANINKRAETMFEQGIVKETRGLIDKYGKQKLLTNGGIIYKVCLDIIDGKMNEPTAIALFKNADWQYARRQKTWFRRNKFIQWFPNEESALSSVSKILNNQVTKT